MRLPACAIVSEFVAAYRLERSVLAALRTASASIGLRRATRTSCETVPPDPRTGLHTDRGLRHGLPPRPSVTPTTSPQGTHPTYRTNWATDISSRRAFRPLGRPLPGPGRLDFAVPRRRLGGQRAEQSHRRLSHRPNRHVEGLLIGGRRMRRAAHLRTYCVAAAWISSSVAGGSKLWSTRMFRHMPQACHDRPQ